MAYNPKHLVAFATGAHPAVADAATQVGFKSTLYHYSTTDGAAAAAAAGYFNGASELLKKGDVILVCADAAGTPSLRHAIVTASAAGAVSIAAAS